MHWSSTPQAQGKLLCRDERGPLSYLFLVLQYQGLLFRGQAGDPDLRPVPRLDLPPDPRLDLRLVPLLVLRLVPLLVLRLAQPPR